MPTGDAVKFLNPKVVHDIGVMVAVRARRLVILENIVGDIFFDLLKSFFQFFDVCLVSIELLLRNEPRDWIQVYADRTNVEARRLNERCAAPHERIQDLLVPDSDVFRVEIP